MSTKTAVTTYDSNVARVQIKPPSGADKDIPANLLQCRTNSDRYQTFDMVPGRRQSFPSASLEILRRRADEPSEVAGLPENDQRSEDGRPVCRLPATQL